MYGMLSYKGYRMYYRYEHDELENSRPIAYVGTVTFLDQQDDQFPLIDLADDPAVTYTVSP